MTPILEVEDLSVRFGDVDVLHDISFAVQPGELVGVIGPNGAGKSTLFRAICGLVNHGGVVEVNGVHCHHRTDRMDIAYNPQQNDNDLHFPMTVAELVSAGRRRFHPWWGRPSDVDRAAVSNSLARVHLERGESRPLNELSGGQLQRAYLARALAQEASIVLLDESLSGVDHPTTVELFELFTSLTAEGTTFLVATHDLALARRRFTRCLAINGTLRGDGLPEQVLSADVLDATFGTLHETRQGQGAADALAD